MRYGTKIHCDIMIKNENKEQNKLYFWSSLFSNNSKLRGRVKYGIINKEKGLSYEPAVDIIFNRKITLKDNKLLDELFNKYDIPGATIKADGSGIEIINLSKFNLDYGKFRRQTTAFAKEIQQRGLLKRYEEGSREVRHIGQTEADALTTYGRIYGDIQSVRKETRQKKRIP